MAGLYFNTIIEDAGLNPRDVRLLRHETKRHTRTPYTLWRDDPVAFQNYQRVQKRSRRAWFDSPFWATFVVTPDGKTLFAGLFRTALQGVLPPEWVDPISLRDAASLHDYDLYHTVPLADPRGYAGRLVIDWGVGTRSWTQRAGNQNKEIIELHERFIEPLYPGHTRLVVQLSEVASMPVGWRAALASARGVYLLTCPQTREQYVGSASGSDGFFGRWLNYAADGHGGNIRLKLRDASDYRVSILQVAGSADGLEDILAMEALWKAKLQSREMGLNAN